MSTIFILLMSSRYTCRASCRSLLPSQSSHGSNAPIYLTPRPLQVAQAPYGELKENNLGSISGKEKPQCGQVNLLLITVISPSISISNKPSDSLSACSIASLSLIIASLATSFFFNSSIVIESISIEILCFLFLSKTICSRRFFFTPSIITSL